MCTTVDVARNWGWLPNPTFASHQPSQTSDDTPSLLSAMFVIRQPRGFRSTQLALFHPGVSVQAFLHICYSRTTGVAFRRGRRFSDWYEPRLFAESKYRDGQRAEADRMLVARKAFLASEKEEERPR